MPRRAKEPGGVHRPRNSQQAPFYRLLERFHPEFSRGGPPAAQQKEVSKSSKAAERCGAPQSVQIKTGRPRASARLDPAHGQRPMYAPPSYDGAKGRLAKMETTTEFPERTRAEKTSPLGEVFLSASSDAVCIAKCYRLVFSGFRRGSAER